MPYPVFNNIKLEPPTFMIGTPAMTFWQSFVNRPQGLWIRKALFQIHLWIGLAVGVYIIAISVSGSALVLRRAFEIDGGSAAHRVLVWLTDLHDNLLAGLTGRILNGIGALLMTLLGLTGSIVWWPGIKNWRRSIMINRKARFARFNWDLHSAVGFWCALFVLVWGISGILLCFPGILSPFLSVGFRYWMTKLHFGRFNVPTMVLWTLLGLAPAVLACTGALMWWNRVLSKRIRRRPG